MPDADLARIETLAELGRHAEAEIQLRSYLAGEPESAPAMRMLSDVLNDLDRNAESADMAARAVALEPDNEWGHRLLAQALVRVGRIDEAVAASDRAVALAPWLWATHYTKGMALRSGRRPRSRDALDCANQAVNLAPHNSHAHNLAGLCLDDLNLPNDARRAYTEALRLDPQNVMALNNLAASEANSGKLGAASRFLTSGLSTDPHEQILHRNYDVILVKLIRRLWFALIALGVVLGILIAVEAPLFVRAATGVALLGTYAALGWRVTRSLPRGSHRWARGLLGRSGFGQRVALIACGALSLGVLVLAFAPHDVAEATGIGLLVAMRFLGVAVIVVGLANLVRNGLRRNK